MPERILCVVLLIISNWYGLFKGSRRLLFPSHLPSCYIVYLDKHSSLYCVTSPPSPEPSLSKYGTTRRRSGLQKSVTAFVGGTSDVGKYTVRAMASTHGTSGRALRVYIAGRNEAAANTIVAECRKACPAGEIAFRPCQ
ncbi:hypothetical protein V1522DRAFT_415018 [Lipomyces starkeyi]